MLFKILSHVKVAFLVFAKIIEGFLVHLYVFFGAAHTKKFSVLVFAKIIEGFLVHLYVFFWRCTYEHIFRFSVCQNHRRISCTPVRFFWRCTYEQIFRFSVCQNHRRISCTPVRFFLALYIRTNFPF